LYPAGGAACTLNEIDPLGIKKPVNALITKTVTITGVKQPDLVEIIFIPSPNYVFMYITPFKMAL
jgi:hypothetical protein